MKIISYVVILVALSGCAHTSPKMLGPFSCPPDNTPVFVYSDPGQAYKELAESYETNLEGLDLTLEKYDAKFGVGSLEVKKKVLSLQEKLDQENIKHQNRLKAIVISLQNKPCSDSANERMFSYLALLENNALELARLNRKLNEQISSGDQKKSEKVINEVVEEVSVEETADDVSSDKSMGKDFANKLALYKECSNYITNYQVIEEKLKKRL